MFTSDQCYQAVTSRDRRFDGMFFTAVRTTGIFCRPSCPARTPRRENVDFFVTAAAAADAGFRKFMMFMHYPPTNILEETSPFTEIAEEYGATAVVYSHCHGKARYDDSFHGEVDGIIYHLVSSDYLRFKPERIL